ncbi:MAG: TonB-dependent receptor [Spirochaetaceae bacterium]|jgi:vitamin B12 transporter|nr:TonB-dependent receptor [Spirochaetaceae bacterium]
MSTPLFILLFLAFLSLPPAFAQEEPPPPAQEQEQKQEQEETEWDEAPAFTDQEGITVTGTRETSQQMAVVEKDEIQRRAAPDLATLLQEALNLGVTRYGGYGNQTDINLRGFDSERVAFLIDGVPANSAQDGSFDINQLGLEEIERIEVIYGGSDTKYNVSGALGGVINLITVKKREKGLRAGIVMSNTASLPGEHTGRGGEREDPRFEDLLDTQHYGFSVSYGGPRFSAAGSAFANHAKNHFLFKDYLGITRRKDHNEVWDTGASVSGVWDFLDTGRLISSSAFYCADKNIPASGFSSAFGIQKDASFRQNIMLDMPRAFRDDLAAEGSLTWHLAGRGYEPPSGAASQHTQHSLSLINRWAWFPVDRLTLRAGWDYRYINLDSTDMGGRDRHDGGLYATVEYCAADTLRIIPSLKAVFSSGKEAPVVPVPKLGIIWNITEEAALKNNYFRSFKLPDFEDLYWSGGGGAGNPDLKPEDGWGGDIGGVWHHRAFRLEAAFFAQYTSDSIHWASASGVWRPENVGAAVFFGFDGSLRAALPLPNGKLGPFVKITPSLSAQYLRSYLLSYGYGFGSDKRIPYMPELAITGALDIAWASGSAVISVRYESLRYADTANYAKLDACTLVSASVNQNIGRYAAAFAALRNILNQSYQSFADYPMPGLTVTLGMRLRFDIPRQETP